MNFQDSDGAYYWHIKSGTIQRQPPHNEEFQILSEMFDPLEFFILILTAGHLTLITFHQLACRKAVLQAQ